MTNFQTQIRFYRLQIEIGHKWNPETKQWEAEITEFELPNYLLNFDADTGDETGTGLVKHVPPILKIALNPNDAQTPEIESKLGELLQLLPSLQTVITELGLLQIAYLQQQAENPQSPPEVV